MATVWPLCAAASSVRKDVNAVPTAASVVPTAAKPTVTVIKGWEADAVDHNDKTVCDSPPLLYDIPNMQDDF